MKKSILTIIGVVAIGIVVALLFFGDKSEQQDTDDFAVVPATIKIENNKVVNFSFQDYNGNIVNAIDFANKPLVINSWASWCTFCRDELSDFAAAQKEFGDKIAIIAVDRAESLKRAKKYSDDLGVTDDFIFVLDPKDTFYKTIGGFSMPETIFVDKEGNIVDHKRGIMTLEEIREKINNILSAS